MNTWTDDELELRILEAFISHYDQVQTARERGEVGSSKCVIELHMGDVLHELTGLEPPELDRLKERWFDDLVGVRHGENKPLHGCSDRQVNKGSHRWHARAFVNGNERPAWQRVRELRRLLPLKPSPPPKEFDQKFKILLSPMQAQYDFTALAQECGPLSLPISVLFVDIDSFKALNDRYTETTVDKTILPSFMTWLRNYCLFRGEAYRQGGDEFLILLPNCDANDAARFAEKLRKAVEARSLPVDESTEHLTVSLGLAVWPTHGETYADVLQAANRAKAIAKKTRNTLVVAQ